MQYLFRHHKISTYFLWDFIVPWCIYETQFNFRTGKCIRDKPWQTNETDCQIPLHPSWWLAVHRQFYKTFFTTCNLWNTTSTIIRLILHGQTSRSKTNIYLCSLVYTNICLGWKQNLRPAAPKPKAFNYSERVIKTLVIKNCHNLS